MVSKADKNVARLRRHKRVRGKISGTPERPRLDVFRSNMHIYAQIIDDVNGVTLCAASSVEKAFTGNGGNKEAAHAVGKLIAERAAEKGITDVVFDRGGYIFHGRRQRAGRRRPRGRPQLLRRRNIVLAMKIDASTLDLKELRSCYQPRFQDR